MIPVPKRKPAPATLVVDGSITDKARQESTVKRDERRIFVNKSMVCRRPHALRPTGLSIHRRVGPRMEDGRTMEELREDGDIHVLGCVEIWGRVR